MFVTLKSKCFSGVKITSEKDLDFNVQNILGTPAILRGACNFGDACNSRNAGKSNLFFPHVSPTQRFSPSWSAHPASPPLVTLPSCNLFLIPSCNFFLFPHAACPPSISPLVTPPPFDFQPRGTHIHRFSLSWHAHPTARPPVVIFPLRSVHPGFFPLRRAAWRFPPSRCAHSTFFLLVVCPPGVFSLTGIFSPCSAPSQIFPLVVPSLFSLAVPSLLFPPWCPS